MTKKEFNLIAESIWRSGAIKDKNKIKQQAKESMRRLIVSGIIGTFRKYKNFDEKEFINTCSISIIY